MTEDKRDQPDSERLERLYRRAADAGPDDRIDDAILAKAHRAASAPRRSGIAHPGAWGVGLAAAASLVLAVGLFLQQGGQPPVSGLSESVGPTAVESKDTERYRATREFKDAAQSAEPAAPARKTISPPAEATALEESNELDRAEADAAGARQPGNRQDAEEVPASSRDEQRIAVPAPAEEDEQPGPEAWLERIRNLIQEGHLDKAREERREFQAAYPSVEIPPAIQKTLATDIE